jgi:hypothetical protein
MLGHRARKHAPNAPARRSHKTLSAERLFKIHPEQPSSSLSFSEGGVGLLTQRNHPPALVNKTSHTAAAEQIYGNIFSVEKDASFAENLGITITSRREGLSRSHIAISLSAGRRAYSHLD